MKGFPDLPPIWLLGFCVLAWALERWLPIASFAGPLATFLGAAFALAGVLLIFWSGLWFARKKTTIEPHEKPSVLIVEGPYRVSRNPIYLAMVVILAGVVLWQGAVTGLVLPVVFAAILARRFIAPEEAGLRAQFGPDAESFMAATRRWL